ncbi:MAG: 50S ribosomal protein L3 [Deltaproteobacteria bacterium]|nr:50S ribosomal protein L3 [Deltaproteobacteria bacterium]
MAKGMLGTKVGMTQIFAEDGTTIPVTVVQAGPCVVIDKATPERNEYSAVKVGFLSAEEKRLSKAEAGVFKKAGVPASKVVREFRLEAKEAEALKVGDQIKIDIFRKGQFVDVTGISKGKGFQGVMRRHNMKGAARDSASSHEHHRHIGAVGQRKTPGKVWKGKRLPGHMGVDQVTVQNLQVVEIDLENNVLLIRGALPGHKNGLVEIYPSAKNKADRPVVAAPEEVEEKKKGKK